MVYVPPNVMPTEPAGSMAASRPNSKSVWPSPVPISTKLVAWDGRPVGNRMVGEVFKVRCPMRIDGPVEVAEAAHPLQKLFAWLSFFGFRCPVDHHDAGARLHQLVEFVEVRVKHMSFVPCAENHYGRRVLQNRIVFGITGVRHMHGLDVQAGAI